jgi:glyoxylate/hydroxypyruvate reductase
MLRRVAAADAYVRRGRWAADGDYPLTTKVVLLIDLTVY